MFVAKSKSFVTSVGREVGKSVPVNRSSAASDCASDWASDCASDRAGDCATVVTGEQTASSCAVMSLRCLLICSLR